MIADANSTGESRKSVSPNRESEKQSSQEAQRMCKASLFLGILVFCILLSTALIQLFVAPLISSNSLLIKIIDYPLRIITVAAAILSITLALVGKRRLSIDSGKREKRMADCGIILATLYLLLVIASLISSSSILNGNRATLESAWKSEVIVDDIIIKYRKVDLGITNNLNEVYMVSPDYGWLVGDNGTILHYSENHWQKKRGPLACESSVSAVSCVDKSDAWFVGCEYSIERTDSLKTSSLLLHYDGKDIHRVDINRSGGLLDVFMINQDTGWACGEQGLMLEYREQEWSATNSPTGKRINSLLFRDSLEGWALSLELFQLNQGHWSQTTTALSRFPSFSSMLLLDGSLLIGGHNAVVSVEDGVINEIAGFELRTVASMAKRPNGGIWLVGGDYSGERGKIMYMTGGQKVEQEIDFPNYLTSIAFDSIDHGWISGRAGTLIEFRIMVTNQR